jgi:hypothetical protein
LILEAASLSSSIGQWDRLALEAHHLKKIGAMARQEGEEGVWEECEERIKGLEKECAAFRTQVCGWETPRSLESTTSKTCSHNASIPSAFLFSSRPQSLLLSSSQDVRDCYLEIRTLTRTKADAEALLRLRRMYGAWATSQHDFKLDTGRVATRPALFSMSHLYLPDMAL